MFLVCFWYSSALEQDNEFVIACDDLSSTYMIVYTSKHLLWRYDQIQHLPYRFLKIHLRKLEQPFEESRQFYSLLRPASRRHAAKARRRRFARSVDVYMTANCRHDGWEVVFRSYGLRESLLAYQTRSLGCRSDCMIFVELVLSLWCSSETAWPQRERVFGLLLMAILEA